MIILNILKNTTEVMPLNGTSFSIIGYYNGIHSKKYNFATPEKAKANRDAFIRLLSKYKTHDNY